MESSAKQPGTKSGAEAVLITVAGAMVGASIGICLALVPTLISPQLADTPGIFLFAMSVVGTLAFGLFGLSLGSYIGWKFSH